MTIRSKLKNICCSTTFLLCIILIAGILPRLFLLHSKSDIFLHNDGIEYRDIAEQISKGNGFSVSYYRWYEAVPDVKDYLHTDFSRPPILPLLGAGLFLLPFDWNICAKVTTLFLSIFCALSVYLLAAELFKNKKIGVLAAAVFTFYPYSLYYSVTWASENLFLFFLCMSWYFMLRALHNDLRIRDAVYCGGLLALATLTRPQGAIMFLFIGLVSGTAFFINLKKSPQTAAKIFKVSVAFCVTALVFFAPWMVRNAIHTGIPSPFSFYGPYSFSQASSDVSYFTYRYIDTSDYFVKTDAAWDKFHKEKTSELKKNKVFNLVDASPYWKKWAWEYIRSNPEKMLFIIQKRLLHCFRIYPNTVSVSSGQILLLCIYAVFFIPLMLYGFYLSLKQKETLLLLLPVLSVFIMAVPFLMIIRYRYPFFAPFASVYVGCALYVLWEKILYIYHKL